MENIENIEEVIKELEQIDYRTLAEKAMKDFDPFYNDYSEKFIKDNAEIDIDSKVELINMSIAMSLELLNNALSEIEYAYTLVMSMRKAIDQYDIQFNDEKNLTMTIGNNYIESIANKITMDLKTDLTELLTKMKDEQDG